VSVQFSTKTELTPIIPEAVDEESFDEDGGHEDEE